MVIWGAFWGAVLGLLWHGGDWEFYVIIGAVLGALAGRTLRKVVRSEVAAALAAARPQAAPAAPAAAAAATPATAPIAPAAPAATVAPPEPAPQEFADTHPQALPASAPETPPRAPAAPPKPDFVTALFSKAWGWLLGGNTVVRMGVLVLFVGLAFLAKYAIDNALLPPELRLAGIAAAGIALFVTGFRLRGRAPDKLAYALTLQGAGVGVLYLTVFAAFRLYQFLPAGAAFAALGLICAFSAVIALAQNAQIMAFIGFAGGFAAPILVSTGQGNHVGLFSYYLVLGLAIAALAWARPWRALNLLGFFATYGVATAWGVLSYKPELRASTEPFLIGFFLVYLAAGVLYTLHHPRSSQRAVDATLIFGNPIAAFSLQAALVRDIEYAAAFSSLALGALYLALGWWMARRARTRDEPASRWLAECCAALGLGFVTLAVPLALDGRWTSAVWAVEGAAVYWMGHRQARWLARAAGLALQVLAAFSFLNATGFNRHGFWPLANPVFIGALMLSGSALVLAWWARTAAQATSKVAEGFIRLEAQLAPGLFWLGFLWWQYALGSEIDRAPLDAAGVAVPVFGAKLQAQLEMVAWVGSAFAFHFLALPRRARPWPVAATPAWLVLPVMLFFALFGMLQMDHVFQHGGWLAWPLVLVLHLLMLRKLDGAAPRGWWHAVHTGGVWLLVLLVGNLLVYAIGKAALWQTAWATVILLVAGTAVLLALSRRAAFGPPPPTRWPLASFAHAYLVTAAAPLALALALGALVVAVHSDGNARPLPYVPLLNPTDLAVAMALAACTLWFMRLRGSELPLPAGLQGKALPIGLIGIAFVAVNTVWLRTAHHYAGVPWDAGRLFDSFLVQAGYSILWTLLALVLMVAAHRRALRAPWMLGAGLLGLTVLKLFVIDLSNRGGSERIIVFIAVGVLMLVVGYFAPLPPAARKPADTAGQGAQP